MVNPLTYEPLSQTAQFVVTAQVTSDNSGDASILVNPTIVVSGARQNISAAIPNGAQLYLCNNHTMFHLRFITKQSSLQLLPSRN